MTKTESTAPKQADTEYMVLKQVEADGPLPTWQEVGKYKAPNALAANRAANKEHGDGIYVASPARSWIPRTAASQTKTVTEWT